MGSLGRDIGLNSNTRKALQKRIDNANSLDDIQGVLQDLQDRLINTNDEDAQRQLRIMIRQAIKIQNDYRKLQY